MWCADSWCTGVARKMLIVKFRTQSSKINGHRRSPSQGMRYLYTVRHENVHAALFSASHCISRNCDFISVTCRPLPDSAFRLCRKCSSVHPFQFLLGNSFISLRCGIFYTPAGLWSKFCLQNSAYLIQTSRIMWSKISWRAVMKLSSH